MVGEYKYMKLYLNTLMWFAAGWFVTFLVFEMMVHGLKMEMSSIATLFQIVAGILLGGLWQLNSRLKQSGKV